MNNNENKTKGGSISQASSSISPKWIKITDNKFICSECENEIGNNKNLIETSTPDGIVEADLEIVLTDLSEFPSKIIYAICPVCGMEFLFKKVDDNLYLEPSEMQK